ncbi:MAG: PAS domain S-box protein [Gemmatimonadales bacterium]
MTQSADRPDRSEPRAWFRTTLYSIGDAVITTGPDGLVRELNPPAEALTGWTEAEARGRPIEEIFRIADERTHAVLENPVRRVLDRGAVTELAEGSVLIGRDGVARPIADSGAPIRSETGELVGAVLVFRDQTAERNAARALRESESRHRILSDRLREAQRIAQLGSWEIDLVGHRHFWSDEIYAIFGIDPATARPSVWTFLGRVHPEDRDLVLERFQGSIQSGTAYDLRHRIITRSGEEKYVHSRGAPMRDADGTTTRVIGTFQDITDQVREERRSQHQARLVERLSDAVVSTDAAFRVISWNPAAERMFGWTEGEVAGRPLRDVLPIDYLSGDRTDALASIAGNGVWSGEVLMTGRDGITRTVMSSVTCLTDETGRMTGTVGVIRDVSELRALEAALTQAQKMESVGRLAGGVAHDFNNTLQAIINYTELAIDRVPSVDPLHADLTGIAAAAHRSADLARQLLAFARKQTAQPRVVDLNEVTEHMGEMLPRLIGESISLTWRRTASLWPTWIDPSQVDQILANLAVNSRDAIAGTGSIRIETDNVVLDTEYQRLNPDVAPGEYVALTVTDTGAGMDSATLEHLFEPFFTTKELGKGTGLGLAVVWGIVKQYDGAIDVTSAPGQGTRFRICLPRWTGDPVAAAEAAVAPRPTRGTETVAVVEDEPGILAVIRRALEREGYRVLAFADPMAAARDLEGSGAPVDLLLTDVVMPGLTGRDLIERLSRSRPALRWLYMSGYPAEVIADHGVVPEHTPLLQKPFTIRELAEKVRELLDQTA